jgi:predicted metal-dependent hydrolase
MGHVVLSGNPPIEIKLRRSARARRISLRVSRLDGQVTLSLPKWTGEREALAFAREKEGWIRRNLMGRVELVVPKPGITIPFEGRKLAIKSHSGRAVRLEGDELLVPGAEEQAAARIRAFFRVSARDRLNAAVDHYSELAGRKVLQITLRDTRSRWGSCTTDGRLMFSWRLIMAPPSVLEYVAAHEVAHLIEMNHSPAYWSVVRKIYPGYEAERRWLRTHGQELHAIRFGD